jgi:phospholipid transport system substrate-binding protein
MENALAAWLFLATAAAVPATAPRDFVQAAVARVVAVVDAARGARPQPLEAGRAPAEQATGQMRRLAAELFDFDETARLALSRHWEGRSRGQQAEFTALFTGLLERAYVGKLAPYAGARIVYTAESVDGRYATVRSRLVSPRKTEMGLDYRLHVRNGRWKVYDVVVDGVSFVSTWRTEFSRIIAASSYDGLLERLRKQQVQIRTAGVE